MWKLSIWHRYLTGWTGVKLKAAKWWLKKSQRSKDLWNMQIYLYISVCGTIINYFIDDSILVINNGNLTLWLNSHVDNALQFGSGFCFCFCFCFGGGGGRGVRSDQPRCKKFKLPKITWHTFSVDSASSRFQFNQGERCCEFIVFLVLVVVLI